MNLWSVLHTHTHTHTMYGTLTCGFDDVLVSIECDEWDGQLSEVELDGSSDDVLILVLGEINTLT